MCDPRSFQPRVWLRLDARDSARAHDDQRSVAGLPDADTLHNVILPTVHQGQRAPGLRFGTFGLAGLPLVPFPLASQTKFSSSVRKPELESRLLCTGHRTANKQVSSVLFPEMAGNPGFGVIRVVFRCVVRGSFAFVSLIRT